MNRIRNIIIPGRHNKPVIADLYYTDTSHPLPVVLFAHGFKGFKDWGTFPLVAEAFAKAGFAFIKFNFSYNGTTAQSPDEFADMDAFGNNNFTKELDDLQTLLEWLSHFNLQKQIFDLSDVSLAGHSRGGAIAIIKASEDSRIKRIATWASPIDFSKYISPEQLSVWKQSGVIYVENSRTLQQMPLYYQLAEDVMSNPDRINIEKAAKKIHIPHIIIHGTDDETVNFADALILHSWNKKADFVAIDHANHSFGAQHPYTSPVLTPHYRQVVDATISFFRK
ncbi:MAG TPA: dienelactone hydrolase family protein [Bacteroidia bacterium]|nr:dienelactone hydrolase family protein [Bacteroidia bacterium]HNR49756.1 dienelactone hydrolase family protein [Bacteroidia bacterium]HNT83223.1 dienelactone hydrolase family protein [Bacteroidia bacterium]